MSDAGGRRIKLKTKKTAWKKGRKREWTSITIKYKEGDLLPVGIEKRMTNEKIAVRHPRGKTDKKPLF